MASKGAIYPSDQAKFVRGMGVAALKKTKSGLLYMDRIHTGRETVYMEGTTKNSSPEISTESFPSYFTKFLRVGTTTRAEFCFI